MEIKNKNLFREQCYINGEWVNSNNKEIIKVFYLVDNKGLN